ncbi:hypothetical protein ACFX2H_022763 [Malus domestica]
MSPTSSASPTTMTQWLNLVPSKWGLGIEETLLCDRVLSQGTLSPNWDGPFEVVGISCPGSYKLRSSDGKTLGRPWNVDHLKYYYK